MTSEISRQLLGIGVLFIAVVVAILLYIAKLIDWPLIFPLVLLIYGFWLLALAAMQSTNPIKYARGSFGTMSLGLCLIAVGGAWFIFAFTSNILYAVVIILLALGALAIAAALKRK